MLVKTDSKGFVKDTSNRAVLNTDNTALQMYKQRKRLEDAKSTLINKQREEIDELKGLLGKLVQTTFNPAELSNEDFLKIHSKVK